VTHERPLHAVSAEQTVEDTDPEDRVEAVPRSERIGVGGGDEIVAKLQLAARWAELYAPDAGDTMDEALTRFRRAYNYVDSVTKLIEPE
jgi:hypothetical protein